MLLVRLRIKPTKFSLKSTKEIDQASTVAHNELESLLNYVLLLVLLVLLCRLLPCRLLLRGFFLWRRHDVFGWRREREITSPGIWEGTERRRGRLQLFINECADGQSRGLFLSVCALSHSLMNNCNLPRRHSVPSQSILGWGSRGGI